MLYSTRIKTFNLSFVMQSTSLIKQSILNICCRRLEGLLKTVVLQNIVRIIEIHMNYSVNFCYHQNVKT